MITKERLLAISDLNIVGKIEQMNDELLEEYEKLLISFIEDFPEDERKVKAALEEKNFDSISGSLDVMCEKLEKIHADVIVRDCRSNVKAMKAYPYDKIEAFVADFLKATATLSIDIQMAKYLEKAKDATPPPRRSSGEKIILAVDDAAISLSVLKKNLQGAPYKLICVNSGDEALRYLRKNAPDLFILDIEMPKMNGYELAEKIREGGQKAPIIFLTGNATKKNVLKAIESGASDFIVKPIDKQYLAYKINKYL